MTRKYWFISEFYWPEENATGYIMTRIIDRFSETHEAYVITTGKATSERNQNIHVIRLSALKNLDKNRLFQRILKMFITSIRISCKVIGKVKKQDVVVTVTNPAFILIFLSFLKKIKRFRLIVIVHDVFPENLVVAGITSETSFIYKILRFVFNYAYRQADQLVTCGYDMDLAIRKKLKYPDISTIIPNFADTVQIKPQPKETNPILRQLGITDKFIVLFTGNMGRLQGMDNLLETMEILKTEQDIYWLFIGEGMYVSKMRSFVQSHNIQNVKILPTMDRRKAITFLNAGDVGLSTLLPHMRGTGVPSKTYTYMAAGKPIIALMDNDTEIAMMVEKYQVGWVVNPSDPSALAHLIISLKKEKEQVYEYGINARKLCEQLYSVENITKQYVNKILS